MPPVSPIATPERAAWLTQCARDALVRSEPPDQAPTASKCYAPGYFRPTQGRSPTTDNQTPRSLAWTASGNGAPEMTMVRSSVLFCKVARPTHAGAP